MTITKIGRYRTTDGRTATIRRIEKGKAHGSIPGYYDTTWWYATTGEHALCPVDDLVMFISDVDIPVTNATPNA